MAEVPSEGTASCTYAPGEAETRDGQYAAATGMCSTFATPTGCLANANARGRRRDPMNDGVKNGSDPRSMCARAHFCCTDSTTSTAPVGSSSGWA